MATSVSAKVTKQFSQGGAIPKEAVVLKGYVGLAAAASETVANYTESPFGEDMVVLEAYMVVTTVDSTGSADFDIGIADTATGTSNDDSLFDAITTYSTAGVYQGLVAQAVTGGARPIWKAKGTATDSFIVAQQNGNVDASSLVYNIVLVVAPYSAFKLA
jgi:hypothetical protein